MFSRTTQRYFQRRCQSTLRTFSTASTTETKATATTTTTTTTTTPPPVTATVTPPPTTTTPPKTTINYAPGSYLREPPEVAWSFNRDYGAVHAVQFADTVPAWVQRVEQCGTSDFAFLVAAPVRHWFRRACFFFIFGMATAHYCVPTVDNWYKVYEKLPNERQLQILKWIQLQSQQRLTQFENGFTSGTIVYKSSNPYANMNYENELIELGYDNVQGEEREQLRQQLQQEDQQSIGVLQPVLEKYQYFPNYHQFLTQKLHELETYVESTRKAVVVDEDDV